MKDHNDQINLPQIGIVPPSNPIVKPAIAMVLILIIACYCAFILFMAYVGLIILLELDDYFQYEHNPFSLETLVQQQALTQNARFTPTSTLTPTPFPDPYLNKWEISLSDPFDSNDNRWPITSTSTAITINKRGIASGVYKWTIFPTGIEIPPLQSLFPLTVLPNQEPISDFQLDVDVRQTAGVDKVWFGLAFHIQDPETYYVFVVSPGNCVFIRNNLMEGRKTLLSFRGCQKLDVKQRNHLTVVHHGGTYWFYLNEELLWYFNETYQAEGGIGLTVHHGSAENPVTITFDNFVLKQP